MRSRRLIRKPRSSSASSNDKKPYTVASLVELKLLGWSEREMAAYFGKAPSTIHHRLSGLWKYLDGEELEAFRKNKIDLLTIAEKEIMTDLLDKGRREKASLNNSAYAFTQLHQARRLETNLSTVNLALHEIVEAMERERKKEPKELTEETAENERQPENV